MAEVPRPAHFDRIAVVELTGFAAVLLLEGWLPVARTVLPLAVFAWLSLWLRGSSWRQAGLRRPERWPAMLLAGVATAAVAAAAGAWVVLPALTRLTGEPPATAAYAGLRGNALAWIGLVVLTWPLAALLEEMVFRGYLLNRLADLFGRSPIGWTFSVLGSSLLFAAAHGAASLRVLVTTSLMGALEAALYLAWKRNLWLPIMVHGLSDTVTLTLVFLGVL